MHTVTDRRVTDRRPHGDLDHIAVTFDELRPRLLAIATRILHSASEADDVVQDAWIRWQLCDRSVVAHPTAFLVTTTTRMALNTVQSARFRHETAVGAWTPEPVDHGHDTTAGPERDEAIERGVDLLVQRLTPSERAAYVLRRGFDYHYAEIGELLGVSATNVRQLVSRAHKHLCEDRHLEVAPDDRHRLVQALTTASRDGDFALLEQTLRSAIRRSVSQLALAA